MLSVIATIRRVYFMLAAATTRQLDGKACSMKCEVYEVLRQVTEVQEDSAQACAREAREW